MLLCCSNPGKDVALFCQHHQKEELHPKETNLVLTKWIKEGFLAKVLVVAILSNVKWVSFYHGEIPRFCTKQQQT